MSNSICCIKSNMIITIIFLSILLIHISSGHAQAQPVRGGGITNVRLEAGSRNVSERKDSTQEVPLGNISNSSISRDGKVIVTNGRIIRLDTTAPSEIPIRDATHSGYRLNRVDPSGSVVAYGIQNRYDYSIKLLSANTGIFMASHDISKQSDFDALFRLDISENASAIAYTHYNANRNGKNEIFVTEKSGEQYSRPILLDEVEVVQKPIQISSTGDRLYYHATVLDSASNTVTYSFVARKTGRTWSKPEPIRINTNRPVVFMDLDDTGRKTVVAAGELGLAILTENQNGDGWLEPDFLGFTVSGLDKVQLSGNGNRVFVSKAIPPFSKHLIDNGLVEYDLNVYEKVSSQWVSQKLNEEGRNVVDGDILISGDGNSLYWRDSGKIER